MRFALLVVLSVFLFFPALVFPSGAAEISADTVDAATLQSAAEKGDAKAQLALGTRYAAGKGVPQDFTEAAKWWGKAAEQRNAKAAFNLGQMYHLGQAGKQDDAEALKWYRIAANAGHPRAQETLGGFYENGTVVKKSYVDAAGWYEKAANQGLGTAQASLATIYLQGLNYPQAYIWASLAAAQGDEAAVTIRDRLAKALTPEQLQDANKYVASWRPTSGAGKKSR